jgi:thioredoxin-related protein
MVFVVDLKVVHVPKQHTMEKVIRAMPIVMMLILSGSFSSVQEDKKINWLTPEEAEARSRTDPRPILIDLYTDWCGWCKVMDKKTYTRTGLIDYVNTHFHAVRLNAETRDPVKWGSKVFSYNAQAKVNQFALDITQGQLAFPTTVIIPKDGSQPQSVAGYLETKDMELLLKYFGEGMYGKVAFDDFQKKFSPSW